MSDDNTFEYYDQRARQARTLAERATSPAVRGIHLDMASRYADLCRQALARPRSA